MIQLKNINKVYSGDTYSIQALKDVSVDIEEGEFVSIMGRSGSGKTTLLNIIGFLDVATSGTFQFMEDDVSKLSDKKLWKYRRDNIGFVFQNFALINHCNVFDNVALPLEAHGVSGKVKKRLVMETLESLGIKELAYKYPGQISGGQRQRVAIARAIVNNPKIVLADEPTGALDARTGDSILEVFGEINKKGKTVILVTHDTKIAAKTKRIIKLEDSCIVSDERLKPE